MDTIEERIAAAKASNNSYNKLAHINSALDLIILKIARDEGLIDEESEYSLTDAISDIRFPSENKEVYINLEKRIKNGLKETDDSPSLKKMSKNDKLDMYQNGAEIHKNVDELVSEIGALYKSIQK